MKPLDIAQTTSTPLVRFDLETGVLLIAGESYPENSFEFYTPVQLWVQSWLAAGNPLLLRIDVSYLNSSSTKCMLDLFDLLEDAFCRGKAVAIDWRYDRDNPRSLELAEEFREDLTLPYRIVPHEGA